MPCVFDHWIGPSGIAKPSDGPPYRTTTTRCNQGISYTVVSSAIPRSAACCIVGCKLKLSRILAALASSTTGWVTKIAREVARPCTREAMLTVWPK